MKVEEISEVKPWTETETALSPKGPQSTLQFLLALHADASLHAAERADLYRFLALISGFTAALAFNGLRDPLEREFFASLRGEHGAQWVPQWLHAHGEDPVRAIEALLHRASEFAREHGVRWHPPTDAGARFEPGWSQPPAPPFFAKIDGEWFACPSDRALRSLLISRVEKRHVEVFDSSGRILRIHLRPDRKLASALGKRVFPQAGLELVRRRVPQKMLAGALSAWRKTPFGQGG